MKPFVKWAGGKSQLLNKLNEIIPNHSRYLELFIGGGVFFLDLAPTKAIINDLNSELMIAYKVIKEQPVKLYNSLLRHRQKHNKDAETYFYQVRNSKPKSEVSIASRFIYLNKTGFNGLYRLNKTGGFNVPFGKKMTISMDTLLDLTNLMELSVYLRKNDIQIRNQDFASYLQEIKSDDFLFLDPPYDSLEEQPSFSQYTANGFDRNEQIRLKNFLDECTNKGAKWILTNHNTPFINDLYKDYKIEVVNTNRMINSKANNRVNSAQEVIIRNYE